MTGTAPRPLQGVVFDFDGLVLDTETPAFTSAGRAFAEHGVELDREWWLSIIGTADHPHWTEYLEQRLGRSIEDRDAVLERRRVHHHDLIAAEDVRPGVVELLDQVAAAGIPLAVASSSPRDWVAGHLDRLGLRERFSAIRTRDDVGRARTKPLPDLYLATAEALGAEPGRCVAIEDSPNGVAAACAAGMPVVAVPAGMTAGSDCSAAQMVVASLTALTLTDLEALV
jgi:HAD superfamily hydrolase (TIGR01509 family)